MAAAAASSGTAHSHSHAMRPHVGVCFDEDADARHASAPTAVAQHAHVMYARSMTESVEHASGPSMTAQAATRGRVRKSHRHTRASAATHPRAAHTTTRTLLKNINYKIRVCTATASQENGGGGRQTPMQTLAPPDNAG